MADNKVTATEADDRRGSSSSGRSSVGSDWTVLNARGIEVGSHSCQTSPKPINDEDVCDITQSQIRCSTPQLSRSGSDISNGEFDTLGGALSGVATSDDEKEMTQLHTRADSEHSSVDVAMEEGSSEEGADDDSPVMVSREEVLLSLQRASEHDASAADHPHDFSVDGDSLRRLLAALGGTPAPAPAGVNVADAEEPMNGYSDELPVNFVQHYGSRIQNYIHNPNSRVNSKLTVAAGLIVAVVFGLGVGHYIGTTHPWLTAGARQRHRLQEQQLERLRALQDELQTCMSSLTSLTDTRTEPSSCQKNLATIRFELARTRQYVDRRPVDVCLDDDKHACILKYTETQQKDWKRMNEEIVEAFVNRLIQMKRRQRRLRNRIVHTTQLVNRMQDDMATLGRDHALQKSELNTCKQQAEARDHEHSNTTNSRTDAVCSGNEDLNITVDLLLRTLKQKLKKDYQHYTGNELPSMHLESLNSINFTNAYEIGTEKVKQVSDKLVEIKESAISEVKRQLEDKQFYENAEALRDHFGVALSKAWDTTKDMASNVAPKMRSFTEGVIDQLPNPIDFNFTPAEFDDDEDEDQEEGTTPSEFDQHNNELAALRGYFEGSVDSRLVAAIGTNNLDIYRRSLMTTIQHVDDVDWWRCQSCWWRSSCADYKRCSRWFERWQKKLKWPSNVMGNSVKDVISRLDRANAVDTGYEDEGYVTDDDDDTFCHPDPDTTSTPSVYSDPPPDIDRTSPPDGLWLSDRSVGRQQLRGEKEKKDWLWQRNNQRKQNRHHLWHSYAAADWDKRRGRKREEMRKGKAQYPCVEKQRKQQRTTTTTHACHKREKDMKKRRWNWFHQAAHSFFGRW